MLADLGFIRGVFEATMFHHPGKLIYLDAHVDDLHVAGGTQELVWLFKELHRHLMMQVGEPIRTGNYDLLRAKHSKTSGGTLIAPNVKYIDEAIADLGLQGATPNNTPRVAIKRQRRR